MIEVEIVYATPEAQSRLRLSVPAGTSIGGLLSTAQVAERFAGLDLARTPVGVFGQERGRAYRLEDGDRVEIYRPLAVDPKQVRKRRAACRPVRRTGG
ncbi:MAG: RnfH family protein [Gammaproteobacteria bacterium]